MVEAKAVLIFVYEDGALVCQLPPSMRVAASPAPSPRDSSSPLSSPFSHLTIPTTFAQSGRTANMRRTSSINPYTQPPSARVAEQIGGAMHTEEVDTLIENSHSKGVIRNSLSQNTAILISNVSADDDIGCLQQCSLDISSVACVPLRAGNTPFGVVVWINKLSGNPFGDDDIPTLTILSAIVSANLSSSAYFSSCALQLQQVSALRFRYQKYVEICVAILEGHRTMAHVCETMMKQCAQLVNCERCTLYIADAARQELYSIVASGLGTKEIRLPSGVGLAGSCHAKKETLLIPNCYADVRFNQSFDKVRGFVCESLVFFSSSFLVIHWLHFLFLPTPRVSAVFFQTQE